jgi:hypothetical protein
VLTPTFNSKVPALNASCDLFIRRRANAPLPGAASNSRSDGAAHADAAQEKEFPALANQWHRDTDRHSSTSMIQSHAALQKIIRMGHPPCRSSCAN